MDSSECGQLGVLLIKLPTVDRATTDRSELLWMNFQLPNTVSGWHESEGAGPRPRGADQEHERDLLLLQQRSGVRTARVQDVRPHGR